MKKFLSITLCFVIVLNSMFGLNVNANDISPQAVVINETTGNNDSLYYAQTIHEDYTVLGTISSLTDVDFYKIVIPETGKANFWLGEIPSGCDYDLYVLNSSGTEKYRSDTNNPTNQELISNKPVTKGEILYLKVTSKRGFSTSLKYKLRVKVTLDNYTHFCQKSDYNNFDITYLKYNEKIDGEVVEVITTFKKEMNSYGCAVSSYAMILRNLNKYTTTSYKDIRDGVNGLKAKRIADPVSVSYANIGFIEANNYENNPGKYLIDTTGMTSRKTTSQSPVYTYPASIGSGFGVNLKKAEFTSSYTEADKKGTIAKYLVDHPEGICAYFTGGRLGNHMIVIRSTTYEAPKEFALAQSYTVTPFMYDDVSLIPYEQITTGKDTISLQSFNDGEKFIVHDPQNFNDSKVKLSDSWTANTGGYSWANLSYIYYIDKPEIPKK